MDSPNTPRRVRLLGGEVDLVGPAEMLRFVDLMASAGGPAVIANHNAHSLFLLRRSAELRAFFDEADLIQIDSTPLIAWGRLLGLPLKSSLRSTYLDWRDDFWRLANERGWKVFYLGGAPGVAETAAQRLSERWPNVTLATRDGYFDQQPASHENRQVLDRIEAFSPDILLVGMGMPLQEAWVWRNREALTAGVIFTVGAAFDYEAGVQAAAPRWTGKLGVEWLARLVTQPRRLAFRYLVEPWSLIGPALEDLGAALRASRTHP